MPRISVIVVNWNGLELLKRCLASLRQQDYHDFEVVLVENGSQDGSAAWARAQAPEVRLVELDQNRGFSGGVNAGLAVAQGRYLVLLNNDATAEPGFLRELSAPLDADHTLGSVAGVLLFEQRPDLVASAGIMVGRDGLARDLWALRPRAQLPSAPVPIFGPSGGAVCYRRELLDDVGLLSDEFFAYLEDADLAWRARLRGWHSLVAPAARALHRYSATGVQGSPFKDRMLARNRVRTIVRCLPGPLLLRCLPAILSYDLQASGLALLRRRLWTLRGRAEALGELPRLWRQRRAIQARRTVALAELERWLEPAVRPWHMLREQRLLAQVLGGTEEPSTNG